MISELIIKNFRCFQNFKLNGIRPVTLIAGSNCIGKSTLLECLYLYTNRYSADVFIKLNAFRGIPLFSLSPAIWESFFNNMDLSKSINFSMVEKGITHIALLS